MRKPLRTKSRIARPTADRQILSRPRYTNTLRVHVGDAITALVAWGWLPIALANWANCGKACDTDAASPTLSGRDTGLNPEAGSSHRLFVGDNNSNTTACIPLPSVLDRKAVGDSSMRDRDWLTRLHVLADRFEHLGLASDLPWLDLGELWGVYCYLRRLDSE